MKTLKEPVKDPTIYPFRSARSLSSPDSLRTSCLINNYNYANYVCEAVQSALDQERHFDEIIVVDDGSTDRSIGQLRHHFGSHQQVKIVAKAHGGQLSCFREAVSLATGDVLFFLDSDDRYDPRYCHTVVETYAKNPSVDFISVNHLPFGSVFLNQLNLADAARSKPTRDLGMSVLAAIFKRQWIGSQTSCLSMRAELCQQIFPYPHEQAWKIRGDDVLVFGSSILGAHKFHLGQTLVHYRLHGSNQFSNRELTEIQKHQYALEVNRLVNWYVEKVGYDREGLLSLVLQEFRTIDRPSIRDLFFYLSMLRQANCSFGRRMEHSIKMARHLVKRSFLESSSFGSAELASKAPEEKSRSDLDDPAKACKENCVYVA